MLSQLALLQRGGGGRDGGGVEHFLCNYKAEKSTGSNLASEGHRCTKDK